MPAHEKLTPELAFAIVLRENRLRLGLDQAALEDEGMDRSYVSKLELGERQVALRGIFTIAKNLGMEPWALIREVAAKMQDT